MSLRGCVLSISSCNMLYPTGQSMVFCCWFILVDVGSKLSIFNMVIVCDMCTYVCTLRMICLGRDILSMSKWKIKNLKISVDFHYYR